MKKAGKLVFEQVGLTVLACLLLCQSNQVSAEDPTNQGEKMLQEAIAALGGEAYLSVKNYTVSGRFYSIYHGATSGAAVFVDYVKYPDKERQEIGKKKESIIINNGEQGWEIDYRAVRTQTVEQIESYRRAQKYSLDRILRFDLAAKKYRVSFEGTEYKDSKKFNVISLEDASRERLNILINVNTHLPEALRYKTKDPKTGGVDQMESWYAAFRSVQGIMTSFRRERIRNGERITQTFVNELQYNSGVSDSFFTAQGIGSK